MSGGKADLFILAISWAQNCWGFQSQWPLIHFSWRCGDPQCTRGPSTGVEIPGQFQLRSQDPGLPPVGLILRLWWLTRSGEALQPLLPWAIPVQFHSFYLTLGQQVVFRKLELQESPLLPTKVASGQTPDTGGNRTPDLSGEKQRFTTEPSWQPSQLRW